MEAYVIRHSEVTEVMRSEDAVVLLRDLVHQSIEVIGHVQ